MSFTMRWSICVNWLTVPAFAEHLSVSDKTVRKWIKAGVLTPTNSRENGGSGRPTPSLSSTGPVFRGSRFGWYHFFADDGPFRVARGAAPLQNDGRTFECLLQVDRAYLSALRTDGRYEQGEVCWTHL
jgi:hypothetical protein